MIAAAMPASAVNPEGDPLRSLFDAARRGDDRALAQLCTAMRPRLYRAAYALLRDRDDADDVAQEALVRAVTRRFLFLGTGSVGGWMTRIACNLAKNKLRDARRRREILDGAQPAEAEARGLHAQAHKRADAVLVDDEDRQRLLQSIELLPERQRDVLRLRALGQLEFRDIAAALQITEANARVTFSQAQKHLLEKMRLEKMRAPKSDSALSEAS
jgi:RNA polymerase sigma-70 factor (ECF subfamily)